MAQSLDRGKHPRSLSLHPRAGESRRGIDAKPVALGDAEAVGLVRQSLVEASRKSIALRLQVMRAPHTRATLNPCF